MRMNVVLPRDLAQDPGEDRLAGDLVDEVHLGGRQVDVRGHHVEALDAGVHDRVMRVALRVEQEVVDRRHVVRRDAETGGQCALRVEVDGEHLPAVLRESCGQVDGGRRLADAALLIAQRDDACRAVGLQRFRIANP